MPASQPEERSFSEPPKKSSGWHEILRTRAQNHSRGLSSRPAQLAPRAPLQSVRSKNRSYFCFEHFSSCVSKMIQRAVRSGAPHERTNKFSVKITDTSGHVTLFDARLYWMRYGHIRAIICTPKHEVPTIRCRATTRKNSTNVETSTSGTRISTPGRLKRPHDSVELVHGPL